MYTLLPFAVFAAVGGFVLWRRESESRQKAESERDNLRRDEAAAKARADAAERAEAKLRSEIETLRKRETENAARIAEAETKLKNADKTVEKLTEVRASMGAEFRDLSQKILEEKKNKIGEQSKELLAPLQKDLAEFRKRADDIHAADIAARAALQSEIKNLHTNAEKYGKSADNLALALKGDSKTQGDWGEITLAALLEQSGLREGREYKTQETLKDEHGKLLRPDVVIQLPDDKHLIIDSKVSLRAFYDAAAADNREDENAALARHAEAVKNHATDLSSKHYAKLKGVNAPDFVFMFMASEPSLLSALQTDSKLFLYAYDKNIILCAPTTLMATLRTVERIWQLERQNRNAEEIAKRGGLLYDKFLGLLKDLGIIHDAFQKAEEGFAAAKDKIKHGRGNLIWQAQQLHDLGVETKNKRLRDPEEPNLPEN